MTRVCLVGAADVNLRFELLSRETSRRVLQTHDLRAPYENTIGLETVSLGGAVSLLNDLNWYIVRFVDEALVLEPSISETEWLSRELATAVRDDEVSPVETGRLLKVYGVEPPGSAASESAGPPSGTPAQGSDQGGEAETAASTGTVENGESGSDWGEDGSDASEASAGSAVEGLPRLVEPMLVTRTGESIPEYDIRDIEDTLVVRVTEAEFENR